MPRPDLSVKIGTPNACNGCHADKTAQWAADQVAAWYGPKRRQEPHFGEVFAAARAGQPQAGEALAKLAADAAATRPSCAPRRWPRCARDGSTGMSDADRGHARCRRPRCAPPPPTASNAAPAAQRLYALAPLLSDPVRAVRIAAARGLSSVPPEQIDAAHRPAFDAALAEYIAAQNVSLDMPGAQLNLAVVYQNTGRTDLAERHYLQRVEDRPRLHARARQPGPALQQPRRATPTPSAC